MSSPGGLGPHIDLLFKALAGAAVEAHCEECGAEEWIVPGYIAEGLRWLEARLCPPLASATATAVAVGTVA